MVRSFSFTRQDLSSATRLEPRFYYYTSVLKESLSRVGIKFEKLGTIASEISDGEHSQIKRQKNSGIRYLYGRNIKEGTIDVNSVTDIPFISKSDYTKYGRAQLRENDILLTIVGTVGKSALYTKDYIGTASIPRHIARIHLPDSASVTPEFLSALMRSKFLKNQIYALSTGNLQPLLSITNIAKIDIPIFGKDVLARITEHERQAIENESRALELINQARCAFYDALSIDFDQIKSGEMFTVPFSKLNNSSLWSPRYYDPRVWMVLQALQSRSSTQPLLNIVEIKPGDEPGSESYKDYVDTADNDVSYIRTTDMANFEVVAFPDNYIDSSFYDDIDQDVEEGDVLFTKDGKIGVTAYVTKNDRFVYGSGIARLRINEFARGLGLSPEYLFIALSTPEVGMLAARARTVIASTIPHLREERLKEIEIPILEADAMTNIQALVSEAFRLKDEKKTLLKQSQQEIDQFLSTL